MPYTPIYHKRKTHTLRKTPTPRKTLTPRKTPTLRKKTPTLRKPVSVVYVIYCHGEEEPGVRVPIPYYKGSQAIRLDYYVECGVKLYGSMSTLESICKANAVPTLSISSGSTANQMMFTGDNRPGWKESMGVYVCDGKQAEMILPIGPNQLYTLLQIIDVIAKYHFYQFSNDDVLFSISIHSCRAFENDPVQAIQEPVIMNPDIELADALANTLRISDPAISVEETARMGAPIRLPSMAAFKTLQQRKEAAEYEKAAIQAKLNDLTNQMSRVRVSSPQPIQLSPMITALVPSPTRSRKTKRKHAETINPINRRKTLVSTPKRTRRTPM